MRPIALRLAFVVTAVAIGVTAVAGVRGVRYDAETARLTAMMDANERDLQRRILDAHADRTEVILALTRVQLQEASLAEADRHLDLDLGERTLSLVEAGKVLREAPIEVGPEEPITGPQGQRWFFPLPRGALTIATIGQGEEARVPPWWYAAQGQPAPGPEAREQGAIYGAASLTLSDGSILYSSPEVGPWAGPPVRPGGIEVAPEVLTAILPNLSPGMAVYVY